MNKTIGAWIHNILTITIYLPLALGMVGTVIYTYLIYFYTLAHSSFVMVMWVLTNPHHHNKAGVSKCIEVY